MFAHSQGAPKTFVLGVKREAGALFNNYASAAPATVSKFECINKPLWAIMGRRYTRSFDQFASPDTGLEHRSLIKGSIDREMLRVAHGQQDGKLCWLASTYFLLFPGALVVFPEFELSNGEPWNSLRKI